MSADLNFAPVGFEPLQAEWWPAVAAALQKPWPREAAMMDLRWWRGQEQATRALQMRRVATMPGRPALCSRWGWTDWAVKTLLRAEHEWADPIRSASAPPALRQPTTSAPPAEEPANADKSAETASAPPALRQRSASKPPRARVDTASPVTDAPMHRGDVTPAAPAAATPLVLSDAWAKHLPTDATTTDTPAKRRPVKRTPRTTTDTHAREVIAGWCDAYREATGATYAITGADSGKLRRAAADYATGEAWADGVERLTRGMATYIRDPKRFPPGPPTVTGFLIDPQRWIAIAESASLAANSPTSDAAARRTNPF